MSNRDVWVRVANKQVEKFHRVGEQFTRDWKKVTLGEAEVIAVQQDQMLQIEFENPMAEQAGESVVMVETQLHQALVSLLTIYTAAEIVTELLELDSSVVGFLPEITADELANYTSDSIILSGAVEEAEATGSYMASYDEIKANILNNTILPVSETDAVVEVAEATEPPASEADAVVEVPEATELPVSEADAVVEVPEATEPPASEADTAVDVAEKTTKKTPKKP